MIFSHKTYLYHQYYRLKIQRFLGRKKFKILSPVVCTSDSMLEPGKEYLYREGHYNTKVLLHDISFENYFMAVDIEFLDEDHRHETCDHKMTIEFIWSGIWQLWDKP
ncbi:MAG: hypothetical protein ACOC2E_03045 [Bacteroidota bacterium]